MPVPSAGREFTFHNPDGSQIEVRGWGDQFAAVFETPDGYTVVRDPDSGFYHYAAPSPDQQSLVAATAPVGTVNPGTLGIAQHLRLPRERARARAQAAYGLPGQRRRWEERREQRRIRQSAVDGGGGPASGMGPPEAVAKTGTRVGLCLLLQFPDVKGTITTTDQYGTVNRLYVTR